MIIAPAGTPRDIVSKVYSAVRGIQDMSEIRQQIIGLGMIPQISSPPDKLRDIISSEIEIWARVIRQAGLAGSEG
jgi:tripartite-type tricarboxylate transporter receptor subunit TctC